ncbi:hypothetical protein E1B28_007535 [Marasmius oreades]|uniref:Uncharacterized protein n=1 Tax=Marasmius oreades TaxID=181124 RepID=A0A9P7S216_9AGAR|nr:uncharacterized protein E1B28_007535 [Marasmius oreades]KAG7093897.1 hypothetical protein E1B28_007535 [Marasmius oreades]
MKYVIPHVYRDELETIWKVDQRLPTLQSRRKWCEARRLDPQCIHRWYSRKRLTARRNRVDLPPDSDMYDLEVGTPPVPEPVVETETEAHLKPAKVSKWPESVLRRSRRIAMISSDPLSSPNSLSSGPFFPESSPFTSPRPEKIFRPEERLSSYFLAETSRIVPTPSCALSAVSTPRPSSPDLSGIPDAPLHCGLSLTSTHDHVMGPTSDLSVQPQPTPECTQGSSNADSDYICALCLKAEDPSTHCTWNDASQVQSLYSLYPSYFSSDPPSEPVLLLTRPLTPLKDIVPSIFHYSDISFDSQSSGPRDAEHPAYSYVLALAFPDVRFSPDGFHICSSPCTADSSCTYFNALCAMAKPFPPALESLDDVLATPVVDP